MITKYNLTVFKNNVLTSNRGVPVKTSTDKIVTAVYNLVVLNCSVLLQLSTLTNVFTV